MSDSKGNKRGVEASLERFADMMIERMEAMKGENWQKPWLAIHGTGRPQNIVGRSYSGSNSFFLMLHTVHYGYDIPCYLTFKQAHDQGCHVLAGEKSFPVIYWDLNIRDENGKRVSREQFEAMSIERQKQMTVKPFLKQFLVFNVAQTNLKETKPELYESLLAKFRGHETRDEQGMYSNPAIDRMIERQEWVCPINVVKGNHAFFHPDKDFIQIPLKSQFKKGKTDAERYADGMDFYSALIHEMGHSTGHNDRLGRLENTRFGEPKYAKEELVAELTAAIVGSSLGFESRITDNSARYVNDWISTLKKEPRFIVSLMSDVNKASDMIFNHIDQQQLAIGETPYLAKNNPLVPMPDDVECPFMSTFVVKNQDGSYGIRTTFKDVELPEKPISPDRARLFLALKSTEERQIFAKNILPDIFKSEINGLAQCGAKETVALRR